ncbi:PREDICTED: uncharacterized protein LOC109244334 [Nicotiana attenuata]|uniref:uncharacterized protein LOC109244334 n=1 Tax=Nicotiana attenuata TaxID=49451 RepID=UPI000905834A|nr:PREDICTED: uncharacterized protein LOC109244334 [Nicotiana attenuata]
MVTSWILNSLSKDLADSLQYVNDAKELWQELEYRYDQTNGTKYQLQKEINDLSQGSLYITRYYTKMKKLWEELNTLNVHAKCACKCTCGERENIHKDEQDRRLIQFLMGLNEVYTVVRGSILMMNPLPTIAQAFSILIQEEKQREAKPSNSFSMDSAALNVSGSGNGNFRTNYNNREITTPIVDIRETNLTADLDHSVTTARGQGTLRTNATNSMDSHRVPGSIREEELLEMYLDHQMKLIQ